MLFCVEVGENPLHVAVRHCHARVVEEVLNSLTNERSRQEAELCVREGNQVRLADQWERHDKLQKHQTKPSMICLCLAPPAEGRDAAAPGSWAQERRGASAGWGHLHHQDPDGASRWHHRRHPTGVLCAVWQTSLHKTDQYAGIVNVLFLQSGETPLHYSARVGNTAVLQEMLSNVPSNQLQTAINKHAKVQISSEREICLTSQKDFRLIWCFSKGTDYSWIDSSVFFPCTLPIL